MADGQRNADIDLTLAVLDVLTPRGYEWSAIDLAELCGCSRAYIYQIEDQAKRKLANSGLLQQLHDEVSPAISHSEPRLVAGSLNLQ